MRLEDAYDYANVGCGEPLIEGKQSNRPDGAAFINITKALEMTLNDGVDPRTGRCLHKGKGTLATFKTYDELYDAFMDQMSCLLYTSHMIICITRNDNIPRLIMLH